MRVATLAAEDDFDGWRAAARALAGARVPPQDVVWQVGDRPTDLFGSDPVVVAAAAPLRVTRAFVNLASQVILHRDPERFALLYALLLRVIDQPHALQDRADPQVRKIEALCQTIKRDMHKMRAFVRFREIEANGATRFVAWFEPEHHIVRANAAFFIDRFSTMPWSILTPAISLHWDTQVLLEGPGARRSEAPGGDPVEDIWKTYFAAIFNPARLNARAMLKEMPKKYWKNMPETTLVADLIATARSREVAMIARAESDPLPRPPATLGLLREEARSCRRCPLWQPATNTVFGEGPMDARIMIVGEQPGDQEDMAGRPFVGPAGAVFDRAMAAAGLDRAAVYITNAVKHFKYEQRGKRRIHSKPGVMEIDACRWWLDQETAMVRPKVVIAMGATAARSVLGRPIVIGRERGRAIRLRDGSVCWISAHPSYILRLPQGAADDEFARLVADLRSAAALADVPRDN